MPGEHRQDADQHEGARLHLDRIDAHQPGAGRIVADQEHMGAKARAVEQDPQHDGGEHDPQRLDRNAEDLGGEDGREHRILVGGQRHAGAVHQNQLDAAVQELRADGDDERGNVEARYQRAVDPAAGRPRRQPAEDGEPLRAHRPSPAGRTPPCRAP